VADTNGLIEWQKEDIPDPHLLYMRVHRNNVNKFGEPNTVALKDHAPPDGSKQPSLSVDWCRYSSPEETQGRTGQPEKYGVVRMVAGVVREIQGLTVEHDPLAENRAHSEIYGNKKDQEVRVLLTRACDWVIAVPQI
jgi:hypothetical protein